MRPSADSRPESEKERIDRELMELLNELRVALPGVQVLFAFLLVLPFQPGFMTVRGIERIAYVSALLSATASTALLIAPTSYHRLRFRAGDKARMLFTSNRLAIAGLGLLAISMGLAIFVVISAMAGPVLGGVLAALSVCWFAWFWYAIPLGRRIDRG